MNNVPKNYPDLYYGDNQHYKRDTNGVPVFREYVRVILWLKTPTGRVSKYYQSVKLNANTPKFKHFSAAELWVYACQECIKTANDTYKAELKKGYTIDRVYLHSRHLERS